MSNFKNQRRQFALVTGVLVGLAFPAAALAAPAQPAKDAYITPGGQVQQDVAGQPRPTSGAGDEGNGAGNKGSDQGKVSSGSSDSSLPFTGMDIALLLGAGGIFLGVGLAMRRLASKPDLA